MNEPILFQNPAVATRDLVRELLADRTELYAQDVTVSTKPTKGDDETRPRPYVHVDSDGGQTLRRVRALDSVRLNINDPDEGNAYSLAELLRALLTARGYRGASRPTPTTDPDTGEPLVTVLLDMVSTPS